MLATPADMGYDTAVVDLAEEAKAKATDRLKTPQEQAADERERLETLEQQRIDRSVCRLGQCCGVGTHSLPGAE